MENGSRTTVALGETVARDIDQKLRLTAALIGAVTRKDLAAAFRRVNASTPFDLDRAHKWLQGRAQPRELQVYEDWVKLLDIDCSAQWVADCDSDAFLAAICARHQCDPYALRRRIEGNNPPIAKANSLVLAGTYVCYTHAWSPYFRGRLVRSELSIGAAPKLAVHFGCVLPTGRIELDGAATFSRRAMHIDVREPAEGTQMAFYLFSPMPPASVLAGFLFGSTFLGPDDQPSVTRIVMVRLPSSNAHLRETEAFMPPNTSVAADLAAMGVPMTDPTAIDQHMSDFMNAGNGGGVDQIATSAYRALVAVFDRSWLSTASSTGPYPALPGTVPVGNAAQ
ncbi:hypothetical protein [Reyranella sp. CPCC 100927]|uniref:hypothetical protein n=1 Tax=Reyranella sp. CPCC 100927 TaxID=2599616 RepID=UPI0011B5C2C9|nr:hypothetical protein [Reyranella sp. CPCC 100927]TWT00290.1 hypothetical protein FQU96_33740 [Reyranella sp. CPCC 100927]